MTLPPHLLRSLLLLAALLCTAAIPSEEVPSEGGGDTGTVILPTFAQPDGQPRVSEEFANVDTLVLQLQPEMYGAVANLVIDGVWYGPVAQGQQEIVIDSTLLQSARSAGIDDFDLVVHTTGTGLYLLVHVDLIAPAGLVVTVD